MPTSGPMLIAEMHVSYNTIGAERTCKCGRSSRLFYMLWLGVGGSSNRERDEFFCSFCFGERAQIAPYIITNKNKDPVHRLGHKLVLLPDPRATLTDEERADILPNGSFDLREWALGRGEGALPYRVREGLDWEKLAEFQWAKHQAEIRFASIFPDSMKHIERKDMRLVDIKQRRTPTATEVDVLERAITAWFTFDPHLFANLDLVWVRPPGEKARTELQVIVCIPNGNTRRLFYSLPQED